MCEPEVLFSLPVMVTASSTGGHYRGEHGAVLYLRAS